MSKNNIVIIDYGIGNIKSIYNAVSINGFTPIVSRDKNLILNADRVILPGVGAYAVGMNNLIKYDLVEIINQFVKKGNPLLGICLGMQMLLEESEEFQITKGLGLIEGVVVKLPIMKNSNEKLPHISWNEIKKREHQTWGNTILDGVKENSDVYFVHSYVAKPKYENNILAITNYTGVDFCSAIQKENIIGTQFHPEKSGKTGLKILNNFLNF